MNVYVKGAIAILSVVIVKSIVNGMGYADEGSFFYDVWPFAAGYIVGIIIENDDWKKKGHTKRG